MLWNLGFVQSDVTKYVIPMFRKVVLVFGLEFFINL